MPDRPVPGQLEERSLPVEVDGRRLRGVIPFGQESHDMGGWREVIDPGALRGAQLDELVATVEHAGVPIGRYPGTLAIEERSDGLHWNVEPPKSRADIVEAVERGDLRASSWRMRVAKEEWRGDVRHIMQIAELRDVAVVAAPAYPSASVEMRNKPSMEDTVMPENTTPEEVTPAPVAVAAPEAPVEARSAPESPGLQVETATAGRSRRRLVDEFRAAGFPGEMATIPFEAFEDRAITWTGSVDTIARDRAVAHPLGADQRYVWPVVPRVSVEEGSTSVDVLTQTARTLPTAANMVRAIDAVTNKPETSSTLTIVSTSLKQVASVQSGIPNVYLETQAFGSIVEGDLRLALNEGLDKLILDAIALGGFQAPGTDALLVSIRKAMTTIMAAGYNPDTLVLTPANAEALDVLTTATAGDYVFGAGSFAPGTLFGLQKRVSKTIAAPAVIDSSALGKLYSSRVSLARFEENFGKTNTSLVRLETHAVFGVERTAAAVRIAAS